MPLSLYLHVPFCQVRCGYCDFNTYVVSRLGDDAVTNYLQAVRAEIQWARRALGPERASVSTVFFGGGTPTLLTPGQLADVLADIGEAFELAPDAEITCEANPETLTDAGLRQLVDGGFNRLSLGMQSSNPQVLAVLERQHTPGRALEAAQAAHEAGFGQVSLDLIYGTPGESTDQWRQSLCDALSVRPDHVSAYALILEEGTALQRRISSGQLAAIDDDDLADKYLIADEVLGQAGLHARSAPAAAWPARPERCHVGRGEADPSPPRCPF